MLGVDWAVKSVIDELASDGRLANSLLIFTADNGVGWGEHRVGRKKVVPYATPVPLYMWWPSRWGDSPRQIDDLVSNIDLAPTLCELAGCQMGPYPVGQQDADGVSLLGLLDGAIDHLARDALLETAWGPDIRFWSAIRTEPGYPLGAWHYAEWASGEKELYDLTADPWELENIVDAPTVADVQQALAADLAQLRMAGVRYQADASIKRTAGGKTDMLGDGVYVDFPASTEVLRRKVDGTYGANFTVRIDNDGGAKDTLTVSCELFGVPYARVDVTTKKTCADDSASSSYTIDDLATHTSRILSFRIILPAGVPGGSQAQIVVTVASANNPDGIDIVRAVAYR
jgi:hypothetical protein